MDPESVWNRFLLHTGDSFFVHYVAISCIFFYMNYLGIGAIFTYFDLTERPRYVERRNSEFELQFPW